MVLANIGIPVNGKKIKALREKQRLSQELLSEQSFHKKCYIPMATLKRAESSKSVSYRTLVKIATFFGIGSDSFVDPDVEELQD